MNLDIYAVTTNQKERWYGLADNANAAVSHACSNFHCPASAIVRVEKERFDGEKHRPAITLFCAKTNGPFNAHMLANDW